MLSGRAVAPAAPVCAPDIAAANGSPQALAWNSGTTRSAVSLQEIASTSVPTAQKVWITVERWL